MWRLLLPRNHIEAHITAARAQIENLPGELRQLDLSTNRIGSLPKGCGGWYRGPRAEEAETSRRAGEVPLASRLQGLSLAYHLHDIIMIIMFRTLDWLRFTYVFWESVRSMNSVTEEQVQPADGRGRRPRPALRRAALARPQLQHAVRPARRPSPTPPPPRAHALGALPLTHRW
jgi:hypothetical protein